jgi:hypothetical protein
MLGDYLPCLSAGTGRDGEDVAVNFVAERTAHPMGVLFTQQRESFVETNAAKQCTYRDPKSLAGLIIYSHWRKLHNEVLHHLYSSPSIIKMIKSRRMRCSM